MIDPRTLKRGDVIHVTVPVKGSACTAHAVREVINSAHSTGTVITFCGKHLKPSSVDSGAGERKACPICAANMERLYTREEAGLA